MTSSSWPFHSRRSSVWSTRAIVAASQPLAVQAGLDILRAGGNAADAAVSVAAALNVTEPASTGIGGDCFCLFYDAKTKTVKGLNGSGRAPAALTLDFAQSRGYEGIIPPTDSNSVTVPGAAAGWVDTVELFGSGKLGLDEILAPAISLAEKGFPVSAVSATLWEKAEAKILAASPNSGEILRNGKAPKEGEIIKLPELAETFRALARDGKQGFYEGRIAQALVEVIESQGGVMTLEDLKYHTSTRTDPISIDYGGVRLHEHPPNGQGIVALIALGIIHELESSGRTPRLLDLPHNSAEYLHIIIEALRLGFADAQWFVSDPEKVAVPNGLLDKKYLASRAQGFQRDHAAVDVVRGSPANSCDTVYFSIVDEEGNACSFINSVYHSFGTGIVAKGTGFALQCRGSNFSLEPESPNVLAPGKRPYHTIIPAMITDPVTDDLRYCYGVMGGFMQPQGHVQVLLNILRGMDPQAALDAPRICIGADDDKGKIFIEHGIDEQVVDSLRAMGHRVVISYGHDRAVFGRGQVIGVASVEKDRTRVLVAGSDPRADGCAAPLL
ncbi:gamma-glutamyltranspeptidase [Blyttiomyces helicus]|uniref:Gamma-glutamyltranspeptidase n=1 Tax=Blyttiomyces helicus TaxID=388810 RepID=A0A4P9WDB7_9FUNG|nr:gamma-glutamyltranspeptidase [Blyttiomyces helicus]|eukprot:RKO90524.1 gamma-glutamyltranspeptidase [Blyttiomyces helicus]